MEKEKIHQVDRQCSKCGSWFRRGYRCNMCDTEDELEKALWAGDLAEKNF